MHIGVTCGLFSLAQAVYHNVKPAALQQQLEAIHLQPDKAEAFGNAWSSMGQETVEKFRQRILAPHKVQDSTTPPDVTQREWHCCTVRVLKVVVFCQRGGQEKESVYDIPIKLLPDILATMV